MPRHISALNLIVKLDLSLPLLGAVLAQCFVFRADPDNSQNVEGLQRKVRDGVSKLKGLDIGNAVAVEILAQLIESRLTVTEMVERAYGLNVSDEGYHSFIFM